MRAVFDWAKAMGHYEGDNPVDGVIKVMPKQPARQKHHAAVPYAEAPAFVCAMREGDSDAATKLAFEFLILTAARTGEVLGACWDEIDLEDAVWTVPADRMKAGRAHRVPLSDRALEILKKAAEHRDGAECVFAGKQGRPLSNMALLMTLRRMGVAATVHGFRSAFRDWAAERTNFPREVCERALAHTIKNKSEAAYRRGDMLDKRRKLMDAWSRFVRSDKAAIIPFKHSAHAQAAGGSR